MKREKVGQESIRNQFIKETQQNIKVVKPLLGQWKSKRTAVGEEVLRQLEERLVQIGGGAGFFSFPSMARLTKEMAKWLHFIRDGVLEAQPEQAVLAEAVIDCIEDILRDGEESHEDEFSRVLAQIQKELPTSNEETQMSLRSNMSLADPTKHQAAKEKAHFVSKQFAEETLERLNQISDEPLLSAHRLNRPLDKLETFFNAIFVIKGTAGFFDMPQVNQLSAALLELRHQVEAGEINVTSALGHLLVDAKYRMIDLMEATLHEEEMDIHDMLSQINAFESHHHADGNSARAHQTEAAPPKATARPSTAAQATATRTTSTEKLRQSSRSASSESTTSGTKPQSTRSTLPPPAREKPSIRKDTATKTKESAVENESASMQLQLPEVVKEFITEANEHLETLEDNLLALESNPEQNSHQLIDRLFRAAHSIKGGAGFLGLIKISKVAHFMETMLDDFRTGAAIPLPESISTLLNGVDLLRSLLKTVDGDGEIDIQPYLSGKSGLDTVPALQKPLEPDPPDLPVQKPASTGKATTSEAAREAAPKPSPQAVRADHHRAQHVGDSIRVSTILLNRLMALAGELVLIRNQQLQLMEHSKSEEFSTITQRLNLVTTELQENIMRTRMQPVNNTFNKFPRMVRDLSRKVGKRIELVIEGQDVELDRTILESLSAPLTHLVRNAIDHGIELPQGRRDAGKPETGTLTLKASHEEGMVLIEIMDDGKGISIEKVKQKAEERGIHTRSELDALADRELINLVFHPGFSTADQVTDISGRGVGMDVVRENIEQLGGFVQLHSNEGRGTRIEFRLPLTLAIMPSLIISNQSWRYAIPQTELVEVVCLYDDEVFNKVEVIQETEVCRLRGELLPLVRMTRILEHDDPLDVRMRRQIAEEFRGQQTLFRTRQSLHSDSEDHEFAEELMIVVLRTSGGHFGLVVDNVLDTEEIVVKPLDSRLKDCRCFSGATIMGDGQVALILDVMGLLRHSGIQFRKIMKEEEKEVSRDDEQQTLLFFKYGEKEQFAVPLPLIARVEQIRLSQLDNLGGREMIHINEVVYRVFRLDSMLNVSAIPAQAETAYLIVSKNAKRPSGLLAHSLIDITNLQSDLKLDPCPEPGTMGTFVHLERLTVFLDYYSLLELMDPAWFQSAQEVKTGARILVADASPMTQAVIGGYLKYGHHQVVIAPNNDLVIHHLESNVHFDLLVMGIDSMDKDGLEFIRRLRNDQLLEGIGTLAVSQGDKHSENMLRTEFDAVIHRIDRAPLLQTIQELLKKRQIAA